MNSRPASSKTYTSSDLSKQDPLNPDDASTPPLGVTELPFVDREEELSLLGRTFDQATQGKGQVVFITGEGGIGKTRLVHELAKQVKSQGAIFAVGPSYEGEGLVPYAPWIETVRAIVAQCPASMFGKSIGRTVAEVRRLVPELEDRARELGIKGWLSGPGKGCQSSPRLIRSGSAYSRRSLTS